jgi:GT2 family glycosyltransferase
MKLSVIIVNYNVRYFLDTCLQSALKACEGIDSEIIVVDNNSTDDSVDMLKSDYPQVRLLVNRENAGFSRANNQAMDVAKGDYYLLLNPDTVVASDCFRKCIEYMDLHSDTGGLGVKMIDGSGAFLPESKRGLPTPIVAFYKIFGLSKLFPKSKRFARYHLGYLDENETHEVDILSGAFMFLRKTLIDKIGGLDEAFFMYGEDIDLSYRIVKSGFKNIYFPKTSIIHFKGESTKKSSVNYVLVFYRAMIIFARKHFNNPNARIFSFLINIAVYLRALIALFKRLGEKIYLPLIDVGILWSFLELLTRSYEINKHGGANFYPPEIHYTVIPSMILSWVLTQYLLGGYHQSIRMKNVFKGLVAGAILIFVTYAMLDESLRFSRAVVALSVLISFFIIPFFRVLLSKIGWIRLMRFTDMNSGIIGLPDSIQKVKNILSASTEREKKLFFINPLSKDEMGTKEEGPHYIGSLYQLRDIISVYKLDELIFCLNDVDTTDVLALIQMPELKKKNIYLHPERGEYILRSSSIHSLGEYIRPELNPDMKIWSRRRKRLLDICMSLLMMLFWPFSALLYRSPSDYMKNLVHILLGKMSFVGFKSNTVSNQLFLIEIGSETGKESHYRVEKKRLDYLVNYSLIKDLELIFSNLSYLDSMPA